MSLGKEIRNIRVRSQISSVSGFSKAAGISRETLRKIERDLVVPSRDTLDAIIDTAGPPIEVRDRVRRVRDEHQAQRDGLSVPSHGSEEKIGRMAKRLMTSLQVYFSEFPLDIEGVECYFEFPDGTRAEIIDRFEKVLQEEIRGNTSVPED
jgi:transcriptional regulator with XRE-family HTH domain